MDGSRDGSWMSGLRSNASDAAVAGLCGRAVPGHQLQLRECSTIRGVARAVPHRGHQLQRTRLATLAAAARARRLAAKGDAALQHAAGAVVRVGAPPLLADLSLKGAGAHQPPWCRARLGAPSAHRAQVARRQGMRQPRLCCCRRRRMGAPTFPGGRVVD
eukprot:scaffold48136_cov51-Phaeocystis_antarctica.AAC.1